MALLLVQLSLPFFNQIADKQIRILWLNPYFWAIGVGFSLLTGLIAASYPALYESIKKPGVNRRISYFGVSLSSPHEEDKTADTRTGSG